MFLLEKPQLKYYVNFDLYKFIKNGKLKNLTKLNLLGMLNCELFQEKLKRNS